MAAVLAPPLVTPPDRLALTICIALICHAILILGVSFVPADSPEPHFDTMEVILVQTHSERPPKEASYLSQANLEGAGDSETTEHPSSPTSEQLPRQDDEVTPPAYSLGEALPDPVIPEVMQSKTVLGKDTQLATESPGAEPTTPKPEIPEQGQADDKSKRAAPQREEPSAAQLIANSFAIASLNAEIQQRLDAKAKRPRRKFISAGTREYRYAAYMEAWRAKVERVGNLNYPDKARQQKLSGSLIVEVQINPDGSVKEMLIRRSSGHKLLDDAALRIVQLAAPFAPFPDGIARDVDVLHVTRTWQFLNNHRFKGK